MSHLNDVTKRSVYLKFIFTKKFSLKFLFILKELFM